MYFGGPFLWWVFGNGPQLRTKGRGEEGGREERGGGIVTAAKAPQGSRRVIPCALSSVKWWQDFSWLNQRSHGGGERRTSRSRTNPAAGGSNLLWPAICSAPWHISFCAVPRQHRPWHKNEQRPCVVLASKIVTDVAPTFCQAQERRLMDQRGTFKVVGSDINGSAPRQRCAQVVLCVISILDCGIWWGKMRPTLWVHGLHRHADWKHKCRSLCEIRMLQQCMTLYEACVFATSSNIKQHRFFRCMQAAGPRTTSKDRLSWCQQFIYQCNDSDWDALRFLSFFVSLFFDFFAWFASWLRTSD